MVNLTRIYTKTGDDGTTSLGDMSRTSKNDPRLEAYATVDEANSSIGVVLSTDELSSDARALLVRIQNDLFDVGADLCTPVVDSPPFPPNKTNFRASSFNPVKAIRLPSTRSSLHSSFAQDHPEQGRMGHFFITTSNIPLV